MPTTTKAKKAEYKKWRTAREARQVEKAKGYRESPPALSTMDPEVRLDQSEVAGFIRMSEKWLEKKRVTGGGIPFSRLSGRVRYRAGDVLNWLQQQNTMRSTSEVNGK